LAAANKRFGGRPGFSVADSISEDATGRAPPVSAAATYMESEPRIEPPAIYQHPLAYLLGLEGIALLRAFAGEYDRDFTMARFAEIRALLDSVEELGDGAVVDAIPTTEGTAAGPSSTTSRGTS